MISTKNFFKPISELSILERKQLQKDMLSLIRIHTKEFTCNYTYDIHNAVYECHNPQLAIGNKSVLQKCIENYCKDDLEKEKCHQLCANYKDKDVLVAEFDNNKCVSNVVPILESIATKLLLKQLEEKRLQKVKDMAIPGTVESEMDQYTSSTERIINYEDSNKILEKEL